MPYAKVEQDGQICIYRKGEDGRPAGETLGCHDSEAEADTQLAALYAAMEKESMSDTEKREDYPWDECIAEQTEKYGDEETAKKVCGMIKAKFGAMKKPDNDTLREIEKELGLEPRKEHAMSGLQYRQMVAIAQRAAEAPPKAPIRFVASTEGAKRDGLDLKAEGWAVTNYMMNPIVSWAHDYNRPPIGRATVSFQGRDLLADVQFDDGDPFAVDVERKVRAGFINAVSVGWQDQADGQRDLVDVAVCAVPVDPQALAISRAVEEPDGLRYGVVVSRKNFGDLERAYKLIGSVLKRAKHEPEEDEDEESDADKERRAVEDVLSGFLKKLNEVKHG